MVTVFFAVKSSKWYLLSVITVMLGEGMYTAMIPVLTLNIFGLKRGPYVYSFINLSGLVTSLTIMGLIKFVKEPYGYSGAFVTTFVLQCMGAMIGICLDTDKVYDIRVQSEIELR